MKMRSGISGASTTVSIARNATSRMRRADQQRDRAGGLPTDVRRVRDCVDEHEQPAGHRNGAERVEAPAVGCDPALRDDTPSQQQRDDADRDVQEEDVLPAGVPSQQATGQHADSGAARTHGAPEPECLVALGTLREDVHHDRECRGQDDRCAEALSAAQRDQRPVGRGERAPERREGEHREPDHEDEPPAEEVRRTASKQQEPAERQPVSRHDPLQVGFGEVELAADRRQRDVDDREVGDRHEKCDCE